MPYAKNSDRRAQARRWYRKNMEQVQATNRYTRWRRKYKLTEDDLLRMLNEQHDVCAVCGEPFVDGFLSLTLRGTVDLVPSIDHDHRCCPGEQTCGKCIRAIVHFRCNKLMSMLRDDPKLMRKCVEYLEKHGLC
jgi:hypothetical protein